MLTPTQTKSLREHLEKAQNPIFFFDNDQDGLCSFLLLQRYLGRGKGVPVRSFPDLTKEYFRKVTELNADYIFILDKPVVSKDFFEEIEKLNLPVVWIDHHYIDKNEIPGFVNYYNPLFDKNKKNVPVTALCYQVTQKKEDVWLAVVGCIADKFIPDFYSDFKEQFPELAIDSENAFDIFYRSDIGKVSRILGFALKDRTTNVINMLKFLMNSKGPYDILEVSGKNKTMHSRFEQIDKKYKKFLEKAKESAGNEKIIFFQYGGDLSISSELANELSYIFPGRVIVVAYLSGIKANISIRGKDIKEKVLKAISGLENATGGGHDEAVGAKIKIEDLEKFKKRLVELVK